MCGTGGESMSQWDCNAESPSPCGPAGMGVIGRVEGHTRWVFSGLRIYEDA
jgi:hypothetical protein